MNGSSPVVHREKMKDTSLNLLSLDAIYNGVHEWRKEKVDVAHGNMDHIGGVFPKPVDEGQTNHSEVEHQDTADMRDTSAEGLSSLLSRGDAHHCLKN